MSARPDIGLCHLLSTAAGKSGTGEQLLADHPEFELRSSQADFAKLTGQSAVTPLDADGTGITLSPATTDTDGFYFCMLQRRA